MTSTGVAARCSTLSLAVHAKLHRCRPSCEFPPPRMRHGSSGHLAAAAHREARLDGRRWRRAVRVRGGGGRRRPRRRSGPHSVGSSGQRRSCSKARVGTPTNACRAGSEQYRGMRWRTSLTVVASSWTRRRAPPVLPWQLEPPRRCGASRHRARWPTA
uniref:Uncharacterized protein n=1 Tax=Arundo donax TaxID=35708 RepID=A0A0A9DM06_ARUDO